MKNKINILLEELFDKYTLEKRTSVMKDLIPILWFGDVEAYGRSPKKIITVSLNPSNNEFGNLAKGINNTTLYRFPDYVGTIDSLKLAYDNYFKKDKNPYNAWFKASFGSVLQSFSASHYEGNINTAIHTDIAIPYATNPTWTGLTREDKEYFEPIGQKIWHDLVTILEPDLILISASKDFQNKITFPKIYDSWQVILEKEKAPVLYNQVNINDKVTDVIFQTQGRKPFLNMNKDEKLNLSNILEKINEKP